MEERAGFFTAHPVRHHHLLELDFETKCLHLGRDILHRFLRLRANRSAAVRCYSPGARPADRRSRSEGRLLQLLQLGERLRRIKNRGWRRRRRDGSRGGRRHRGRQTGEKEEAGQRVAAGKSGHAAFCRETAQSQSPYLRVEASISDWRQSPVRAYLVSLRDSMPNDILVSLDLPGLTKLRSGKVREVFDLGETLLFVATDRLSAFDVILPDPIPDKGAVLNQISAFWFERINPRKKSLYYRRLCQVSHGIAALSRTTGGPLHDRAQDQTAAGRVRRAWLSRRLRLEGLSGNGRSAVTSFRAACNWPRNCRSRSLRPRPRTKPATI